MMSICPKTKKQQQLRFVEEVRSRSLSPSLSSSFSHPSVFYCACASIPPFRPFRSFHPLQCQAPFERSGLEPDLWLQSPVDSNRFDSMEHVFMSPRGGTGPHFLSFNSLRHPCCGKIKKENRWTSSCAERTFIHSPSFGTQ